MFGMDGIKETLHAKAVQLKNSVGNAYEMSGFGREIRKAQAGNAEIMALAVGGASFVVTGIVLATGAVVLSNYAANLSGNSLNIVNNASSGLLNLAQQMPTIGLALGAAAVIAIIFGAFAYLLVRRSES